MSIDQTSDRADFVRNALAPVVEIHNVVIAEVEGVWDGEVTTSPIPDESRDALLELAEEVLSPTYHIYDSETRGDEFVLYFNDEDMERAAAQPLVDIPVPEPLAPALTPEDEAALVTLKDAIDSLSVQAREQAVRQGILFVPSQKTQPGAPSKRSVSSTPKTCLCGCGKQTRGGTFIPGHDATLKGRLQRARDGKLRQDELNFKLTPEIEAHIRSNPLWDGWFGQWVNAQKLASL